MPFKCLQAGVEIYAFDIQSTVEWQALRRQNAQTRNLKLPCCGSPVILRTSILGTRHFVHARRNGCARPAETPIHLLAKEKIVAGIRRAGWTVRVEEEIASNGEAWIPDVLALQEGERTHAFEVQWSWQSQETTRLRHARYQAANIPAFWFFR